MSEGIAGERLNRNGQARIGFVLEQALGHVTYGLNIERYIAERHDIEPVWMRVAFRPPTRVSRLPVVRSNWTLRASLEARRLLNANIASLDAVFLHTQTASVFATAAMERIPTVLSLDATPLNFDEVGTAYDHGRSPRAIERFKQARYRLLFSKAVAFTTWSQWAKDSLVRDYGVDGSLVRVLHPGADLALFGFGKRRRPIPDSRPLRLLFVGGDLERKGGKMLIDLVRNELHGRCELHLVTNATVEPEEGVIVHRGVSPNSPELLALYASADLFVLPTRAECLAVVLGEAMAAGLPIITTAVGGHSEAVRSGENGYLLPSPNRAELLGRIEHFLENPLSLVEMGMRARAIAEERFDSRKNIHAIADMLVEAAARKHRATAEPRLMTREETA